MFTNSKFYSGQGETVINILTDLNGFWTYENRELVLAENQNATENTWRIYDIKIFHITWIYLQDLSEL